MDYKYILKKYPKSLDAFCKLKFGGDAKSCMKNSLDRFWGALSLIHDRELYDFFDAHGFKVVIQFITDGGDEMGQWFYNVWDKDIEWSNMAESSVYYGSRSEAERAAFIEAFKLLEPQLKNGTTAGKMQSV